LARGPGNESSGPVGAGAASPVRSPA
jgi:hypothetical protein